VSLEGVETIAEIRTERGDVIAFSSALVDGEKCFFVSVVDKDATPFPTARLSKEQFASIVTASVRALSGVTITEPTSEKPTP
jgi:hypothetical protein